MSEILLLGDRRLRLVAEEVTDFESPELETACSRLWRALDSFRREYGFGRAVAAPQLGIPLRLIATNVNGGTEFLVNPRVTWSAGERFTMWDDCMSFPDLLVRVERSPSLSLEFTSERGEKRRWTEVGLDVAELLQHELDHLDGILAVDRATGANPIVKREIYLRDREELDATVDYTIDRGLRRK
jgi:peptide deformylase